YTKGRLAESWLVVEDLRERSRGDVSFGTALIGGSAYIFSYAVGAYPLIEMGRLQDAEMCLRRGLELAKEHGPEEMRSWAYDGLVVLADARGDRGPAASNWARLSAEAAERAGSYQALAMAYLCLSIAGGLDERWEEAIAFAQKAMEIWRTGFA